MTVFYFKLYDLLFWKYQRLNNMLALFMTHGKEVVGISEVLCKMFDFLQQTEKSEAPIISLIFSKDLF